MSPTDASRLSPILASSTSLFTVKEEHRSQSQNNTQTNHIIPCRQSTPWAWLITIIVSQLLILAIAWGFFAVVFFHGPIPLPDKLATAAATFQRSVTLIVTLVATALSLISAFLFSRAMRYALTARLSRPISLYSFSCAVELSRGSVVMSLSHAQWTLGSLLCVTALSTMTAGWVTLLAPTNISVVTAIAGSELDLGSTGYDQLLHDGNDYSTFVDNPVFEPAVDANCLASASRSFGVPNIVNFNGYSYNTSTSGILPARNKAGLHGFNSTSNLTGLSWQGGYTPSHIAVRGRFPQPSGFTSNYTVIQQGVTAEVSCQVHNNSNNNNGSAFPPLSVISQVYNNSFLPLTVSMLNMTCGDGDFTGSLTATAGPRHNFVIAGVCLFMNFSNPAESDRTSHVLTILGAGQYDFIKPTICTISPKITTVEVSYYSSPPLMINVSRTISARDPPGGGVVAGISIQAFIKRLGLAQSLWDNGIGDALASVYRSRAESVDGDAGQKEELVNVLLEGYLTGMVEIMGSILRAAYSAESLFPNNTVPDNMTTVLNGNWQSETIGWDHGLDAGILVLLPVTFVALLSIAAVVATSIHPRAAGAGARSNPDLPHNDAQVFTSGGAPRNAIIPFNSSDIVHLVVATAAGDLRDVFGGGFCRGDIGAAEKVRVRLGYIGDGKVGLVTDLD